MDNIRQTSLSSHKELIESGNLNEQEMMVFKCIKKNPGVSDREIAELTNLEISAVNGRRNKLMSDGCIIEAGKKVSTTGRTVLIWKIKDHFYFVKKVIR